MLKIKDLHPALHGYEASYTNDLLPQLDPIETRRKALVRHIQKVIGLTLLITIVSIAVLFLLGSTTPLLSGIFFSNFCAGRFMWGLGLFHYQSEIVQRRHQANYNGHNCCALRLVV